jgi:hypothetical protein
MFIEELLRLTGICNDKVKNDPMPLYLSEEDREKLSQEIFCHYCQKEYTTKNLKLYHHRHVNSVMYGEELTPLIEIICNKCNLALKQKAVVALGHELTQLEYHFILNALDAKAIQSAKVLCRDTENIIAIEINGQRIVDTSNLFCNASLDSFVIRQKSRSSYDDMKTKFPNFYDYYSFFGDPFPLVSKISFPLHWLKSIDLMDQHNFPEMEEFNCFDQIMDEVTHQSSNTAFNSFKCNTITDYAKLFLLSRCLIHSEICNSLVPFGMKQFGYYPFQD